MSDSTPQERRKALFDAIFGGSVPPAASIDNAADLVESWLAEQAVEIERLRVLYEQCQLGRDVERQMLANVPSQLAEKDAAIEIVWREVGHWQARAKEERRRTAERVKGQVHAHMSTFSLVRLPYLDVAHICDEVGGSDE